MPWVNPQHFHSFYKYSTNISLREWVNSLKLNQISEKHFTFRVSRSSGPGGQHVNTTNTKVDARIKISEASWIPEALRKNIMEQQAGRINRDGELMILSDRFRTQECNKIDALERFLSILKEAAKGEPGETPLEKKILIKKHQLKFEHSIRQEKTKRKQLKQNRSKSEKVNLF